MTKKKTADRTVTIRLPVELLEEVVERANADDRSMSSCVRLALGVWLEQVKANERAQANR